MVNRINVMFVNYSDNLIHTVRQAVEKSNYRINPHVVVTDTTKLDFEVVRRFSYRKCSLGMFQDFDSYNEIPLDSQLLDQLRNCESNCLKMLDRYDDTGGLLTYQQRINLYHNVVRYWYNYLIKHDVKASVFTIVPHVVSDYILYHVSKILGIKTLMFYRTNVVLNKNVSLYPLENIEDSMSGLKETYAKVNLEQEILLDDRFSAYLDIRDNANKTFTGATSSSLKNLSAKKIVSSIRYRIENKVHWYKHGKTFTDTLANGLLRKKYFVDNQNFKKVELLEHLDDKKYVYLPLHFQPECSSCPLGGDYVHQDLMIDMLVKSLPDDWLVVVKKHVKAGGKDYALSRLRPNDKVILADNSIKSLDLVKQASAIATVTGTAGFEGFLNHKPVFIFGSYFYMDAPNVFKVSDTGSLKHAINTVVNDFKPTTLQEVKAFLYACQLNTSRAWVDNRYRSHCGISDAENANTLSGLILEKFNKWNLLDAG
ncbi:hypothetical protein L1D31_15310 [Vibrio sp. Isolate23]|uniref:capsular polysaccharide export protein, LipB/KpsS family n=1 Tax=Vibrio sp. Isolate23 TaxID=2908533 RepID=UPI001EFCADC7|nr:hypothetical protein [Vibrio sp. Isolate23]MCG9683932.1 hypothetical protein [Vibrio sp. Isolate23]